MVPDPTADSGSGGFLMVSMMGVPSVFLFNATMQPDERVCLGFVDQENLRFCLCSAARQDPASGK